MMMSGMLIMSRQKGGAMAKRKGGDGRAPTTIRFNFVIERDKLARLKAIEKRDGINVSEQIRRAVDAWLKGKE
jgi:hypothetical protein